MKQKILLLFLALGLICPTSFAEVEINGFVNIIGGTTLDEEDNFLNSSYSNDIAFEQDSLFGIQIRSELSEKLSVTGQLISRGRNGYSTELDWGYLSYKLNENATLRFGRLRSPLFLYSDFLDVGYAYPWITPPRDVYNLQLDNFEGLDFVYTTAVFNDALQIELQTFAGSAEGPFVLSNNDNLNVENRNQFGLVSNFELGDFSLRLSTYNVELSFDGVESISVGDGSIQDLLQSLEALTNVETLTSVYQIPDTAPRAAIAAGLSPSVNQVLQTFTQDTQEIDGDYYQASLKYDNDRFFIIGETTDLTFSKGPFTDQSRYFVSIGAYIGSITAYFTRSESDDDFENLGQELQQGFQSTIATLQGANAPQSLTDALGVIGAQLNAPLVGISDFVTVVNETTVFGLRYDFEPGAAIKVEYERSERSRASDLSARANESELVRFGVQLVF